MFEGPSITWIRWKRAPRFASTWYVVRWGDKLKSILRCCLGLVRSLEKLDLGLRSFGASFSERWQTTIFMNLSVHEFCGPESFFLSKLPRRPFMNLPHPLWRTKWSREAQQNQTCFWEQIAKFNFPFQSTRALVFEIQWTRQAGVFVFRDAHILILSQKTNLSVELEPSIQTQ